MNKEQIAKTIAAYAFILVKLTLLITWKCFWVPTKWVGRQLASPYKKPTCKYCGSHNNNLESNMHKAERASKKFAALGTVAIAAPFVGNNSGTANFGECYDCGKKWRL